MRAFTTCKVWVRNCTRLRRPESFAACCTTSGSGASSSCLSSSVKTQQQEFHHDQWSTRIPSWPVTNKNPNNCHRIALTMTIAGSLDDQEPRGEGRGGDYTGIQSWWRALVGHRSAIRGLLFNYLEWGGQYFSTVLSGCSQLHPPRNRNYARPVPTLMQFLYSQYLLLYLVLRMTPTAHNILLIQQIDPRCFVNSATLLLLLLLHIARHLATRNSQCSKLRISIFLLSVPWYP